MKTKNKNLQKEVDAEFDDMVDQAKELGRIDERQRIVNILNNHLSNGSDVIDIPDLIDEIYS